MKKTVKVEGMMCDGCVATVQDIFQGIDGVKKVKVDLAAASAEIESENEISLEQLQNAIEDKDGNYEVSEF